MSAIYTYGQWIDIVDRGTSGDQVMDILASWKVDAYKLLEDNHKLESRIAELEAALVSSGNQQGLHLEELLDLRPRIAELESTIERLIEAGKRLLDSLCTDPEEEKTVEVMNWKAVVDKVNKERER